MKKIIFLLLSLFLSTAVYCQNLALRIGKDDAKVVLEGDKFVNNNYFYGYAEVGLNVSPYIQLIYERTLWNNLGLHTEFRTDFSVNTYFVGPVWSINFKSGAIMVEPLCRYEGKQFYWQGSVVASFNWEWCDLYGLIDVWGQKTTPFVFSELRYYVNLDKHLALGAVGNFMYFDKFDAVPYLSIRYKF